jgi:hypothetical protein
MFGLGKKVPPPSLLGMTPLEYSLLNDLQVKTLAELINTSDDRKLKYAAQALWCSTICFVVATATFFGLVALGHNKAAGVLLSTTVIGFLGRFIKARL